MEEGDIKLIQTNIDSLVEATNYELLMQKCIDKGIISIKMKQVIERVNHTTEERHKALFEKITTRDNSAFNKLVSICNEHFERAAFILEPHYGVDIKAYTKNQKLSPFSADQCAELQKFVDITKPDEKTHPSKYSDYLEVDYAGVLFFINYTENRPKANEERGWLLSLFHQLNFQIFYLEDQNVEQIHNSILTLKQIHLWKKVNCFFYIQLGTGTLNDVYFNDNTAVKVTNIIDAFNNKNCGLLLDVQKVFIFPSVSPIFVTNNPNKIKFEFGIAKMGTDSGTKVIKLAQNVSTRSNNLYFYFENDGGSFEESIKIFCKNVAKYAYSEPLQNILKLYFLERRRAEHSDYRETVDEGCTIPFHIPNIELIRKYLEQTGMLS